jgi:hypothetical protein
MSAEPTVVCRMCGEEVDRIIVGGPVEGMKYDIHEVWVTDDEVESEHVDYHDDETYMSDITYVECRSCHHSVNGPIDKLFGVQSATQLVYPGTDVEIKVDDKVIVTGHGLDYGDYDHQKAEVDQLELDDDDDEYPVLVTYQVDGSYRSDWVHPSTLTQDTGSEEVKQDETQTLPSAPTLEQLMSQIQSGSPG